ncbi:twin-arginine translocase subunit TatB [Rhizobiales bacterium RZME27]|jgi:sec-independent protein translocase protein TatB|uniref:Sec-independent protein translocase protein TatB n=1 Tax=Endobacterium cereale TaxID=2663029 RepID=A0A6A8AL19_9HYPH|nr:Sec-independent protein translocase protein TatB [Endobacterium cereale]MEB2843760.1 Sec-independent protein translocase protein TatB [Endobacterium cereale]MQY49411.1 twin-arginine translocase subunit TatB [Endobacterium cereale]
MLDIGWTELLVIAIVLIVVVGPKDLPPMLRAFGKMTSNLRKMAGDFRTQFDEALREADMDDVRKTISDAKSLNPANALRDAINPLRQMGQEIREDLQKATAVPKPGESVTSPDDPLLTGEGTDEAADEADKSTPQTATGPVQTAVSAPAAAVATPMASASAKPTASATVPDTLSSAPDVPVRKPRASRQKAEGETPVSASAPVKVKPAAKKVVAIAPKASASKSAPAKAAAATKASAKKAAQPEVGIAEMKTPRAPRKAKAPKDEA